MSFVGELFGSLERSSAGSVNTVLEVLKRCESIGDNAFFVGDELATPREIAKHCADIFVGITEPQRAEQARHEFAKTALVGQFELPKDKCAFGWYNTNSEFERTADRLVALRESVSRGGAAVFRALCWLIEPSPDTKSYCAHRFGQMRALDEVLREAREQGFSISDFYIAPKSDWTDGLYRPLLERADKFGEERYASGEIDAGLREIKREADMFELHCEEYSFVYYILKG